MKTMKTLAICAIALLSTSMSLSAQETAAVAAPAPAVTFNATADLVTSYVWRGVVQGTNTPNFQPTVSATYGNLTLGTWGSGNFIGGLKELDVYLTYTFSPNFAVTATDYNWTFANKNGYFDYSSTTDHLFEATVAFTGPESFPISASVNTMFLGADKKTDGTTQAYSTYAELGYQVAPVAKLFLGASLMESNAAYATTGFGIINAGVKATRNIAITDKFTLPVYGVLGANPYAKNLYLVFGITL
jgi:Bacterial protein of unknown function (Gcw_chp)